MERYKLIRSIFAILLVLLLLINPLYKPIAYATVNDNFRYDTEDIKDVTICDTMGKGGITFEESYRYYGDANSDGDVNLLDVVFVQRYIAGIVKMDNNSIIATDLDNSGEINLEDVVIFQRYLAHLIKSFSVGVLFHII